MLLPFFNENAIEAGCDEAGRGCLAGDVFAAAVILPPNYQNSQLNDSKKLTEKQRYVLRDDIIKNAIAWSVQQISVEEIDQINILNASFAAMEKAIKALFIKPEMLLIDGNRFKTSLDIPFQCIIKGDGKIASIAAASILAKTFRDDYMKELHKHYTIYGWDKNKGYPTAFHRNAVARYGLSPYHRKTFCSCCFPK